MCLSCRKYHLNLQCINVCLSKDLSFFVQWEILIALYADFDEEGTSSKSSSFVVPATSIVDTIKSASK